MIVYRVQNENGIGPYGSGIEGARSYSSPVHDRPGPWSDFKEFHGGDWPTFEELTKDDQYKYAFPSLRALRAWWCKDSLHEMAQEGFKVHRFRAEDVLISDSGWQCIFRAR